MEEKLHKDDISTLDNTCRCIMLKGVGKPPDVELDFYEASYYYFYSIYFDGFFFYLVLLLNQLS